MGVIENFKEVADLVKKAGDLDLYRKIVALEGQVIELTRANRHLQVENEELKNRLAIRTAMTFKAPLGYAQGDAVPHCPRCWESEEKQIHLQGPVRVSAGTRFDCPKCKEMFITDRPSSGR